MRPAIRADRSAENGTWNIAEVEILEARPRLRARLKGVVALWACAFLLVVAASFLGLGAAEAAPTARLGLMPTPGAPALLAGVIGGAGSVLDVLWRRMRERERAG